MILSVKYMINFLYCLDENYNIQAFTSILSLLDNLSEKANFLLFIEI